MDRPLHRLKSFFRSIFEPKKKNPISLRDDENLDSHHKILKVGDKNTTISLKNDGVDVQGDLTVSQLSLGALTITSLDKIISGNLTFDSFGFFTLEPIKNSAVGVIIDHDIDQTTTLTSVGFRIDSDITGDVGSAQTLTYTGLDIDIDTDAPTFHALGAGVIHGFDLDIDGGTSGIQALTGGVIDVSGGDQHVGLEMIVGAADLGVASYTKGLSMQIANGGYCIQCKSSASASDFFFIEVGASALTTLSTKDSGGDDGHLVLSPDGDVKLTPETGIMYLYDRDNVFDYATFTVGSNGDLTIATVDAAASLANITLNPDGHIALSKATVFGIHQPTYGDVLYTANTGNNTDIDFRTSNKAKLTLTGGATVAELGFVFPNDSGNFVLVLTQDGSGTGVITDYKAYTYEGDDATSHDLKWAGVAEPTLTNTAGRSDIISIFWDNHLEKAYATITYDFD